MEAVAKVAEADRVDAFAVKNRDGAGSFVILCDHASNRFPPEYRLLGLAPEEREAHIAWDPGALGVARELSERLDAPLVYSKVSRLVIDCNRALDAPDLIAEMSEATPVPGNIGLSAAERDRRIVRFHAPYHDAIDGVVDARLAAGHATALVAVHSFTPIYRGVRRPWEIGIVFDRYRRLADHLTDALKAEGLKVGVNEPYSPADRVYYTLTRHAESRGLGCAMLEIRNDLIRTDEQATDWGARLAALLAASDSPNHEWSAAPRRRDQRSVA